MKKTKQLTQDERVDLIIRYESDELDDKETLKLFCDLIKNGMAWTLQGHYGRVASSLIEEGYISKEGELLLSN